MNSETQTNLGSNPLFFGFPRHKKINSSRPQPIRGTHLTTAISQQAHHRSWTLYRKEDLKKIFITTMITQQQPAFLSEKKDLKKDSDDYL